MTFFIRPFFHGKRKFTALIAVGIMLVVIPVLIQTTKKRQDIRQRASETTGIEYNVKNYGAIGDGLHHPLSALYQNVAAAQADYPFVTSLSQEQDWAGIQKAINSVTGDALATVLIPPGRYKVENIIIRDKSNLRILGNEATLELSSDVQPIDDCASDYVKGVNAGIQLIGSITNLTIENLVIHGQDGVDPAECAFYGHAGIWEYSGQNLTDIKILNNTITNVRLGIGVSASGGGSVNGVLIQGNRIENAVGVRSGEGYGIATGNQSLDNSAEIKILNNTIINAERHAIYQGWGTGVIIANNTIRDHRTHIPNQALRGAIVASRSRNVAVEENTVDSFNGGAVEVSSANGVTARNISVTRNTLTNPRNNSPTLFIGSQNPNDQEPAPELVVIRDNTFSQDGVNNSPLHILSAKQLQITNNAFSLLNTPGPNAVSAIVVSAVHQAAGSHNFIDDLAISNNTIVGSNNPQGRGETHGFMITTEAAQSSARIVFSSNQVTVPDSIFYIQSPITNPNIIFVTPTPTPTATPVPTNTPVPTATPTPTPIPATATPANTPTPTTRIYAEDVDRNGCVGIDDFNAWSHRYRTGETVLNTLPDIDGNGAVNLLDYNIWFRAMRTESIPKCS